MDSVSAMLADYARTSERIARLQAAEWAIFAEKYGKLSTTLSLPRSQPADVISKQHQSAGASASSSKASVAKDAGAASESDADSDSDDKKGKKVSGTIRWTAEEDEKFINLVSLHGREFAKIAREMRDPPRNAKACRNHWAVIEKRFGKPETTGPAVAGAVDLPMGMSTTENTPSKQIQTAPKIAEGPAANGYVQGDDGGAPVPVSDKKDKKDKKEEKKEDKKEEKREEKREEKKEDKKEDKKQEKKHEKKEDKKDKKDIADPSKEEKKEKSEKRPREGDDREKHKAKKSKPAAE
eukprot:ANDGO_01611.mRNA.1 hypothetical protein